MLINLGSVVSKLLIKETLKFKIYYAKHLSFLAKNVKSLCTAETHHIFSRNITAIDFVGTVRVKDSSATDFVSKQHFEPQAFRHIKSFHQNRLTVQILCIGTDRSQQTVQTKIRLLLISIYAVCHSISIFWMHLCNVTSNFSIFRTIMAIV